VFCYFSVLFVLSFFFLHTWNLDKFFRLCVKKFSSAAPNEDDWKIDIDDGDGNNDIPEEKASDDDGEGRPRNRLRIC
jgi:hypothetical protein